MRLTIAALGCVLCAAPISAQALDNPFRTPGTPVDTTSLIRFSIPAQPLSASLREFARQAGVRVQADVRAAAAVQAPRVTGVLTIADALRQLLAGSGMSARYPDGETVVVSGTGSGSYTLTGLSVVAPRSRGYAANRTTSATKTDTPLRDAPQAVSVLTQDAIADQAMQGMADVVRFVPGITMGAGEGHRDAPTIRGNASTADFFVDGVRDDAQYLRDLYNVERVEALKGSNAMIFGRGGGGGVLNRVIKSAQWAPTRVITTEGGSFDHKRGTLDLGDGFGSLLALRLNGLYENSGGFRDYNEITRWGVSPSAALALGTGTTLRLSYEHFVDERAVDRGIPSYQGRPSPARITTFFGNPDSSYSAVTVNTASALFEYVGGSGLTVRNRTRFTDYDKFYQNSLPGAVNAAGTQVALSAYSNSTDRRNLFNQTDVTYALNTGAVRHTLLVGAEIGRQETDNYRSTGFYNNTATSFSVPFDSPTTSTPITFRQSASDADSRAVTTVAGVYAQDQVELSSHWQAVLGIRFDRFAIDFHNNRNDQELDRRDDLISPRAGLIFKPVTAASIYGSYSISFLPSSGDQFGSLTATTETLEPERFTNYEVGAKWDVRQDLSLTAAVFRLDRTNTTSPDPNDPTRVVQTGSQRTTGLELGATGQLTKAWQVVAGAGWQDAEITSRTVAAAQGARVALVPVRTFSLWNRYQLHPAVGVGLGLVHRADMFAAIDNTVTLPAYTRADAALFVKVGPVASVQVNVENLLDDTYYNTSHGNNNIMPGATRTIRVSLSTRR